MGCGRKGGIEKGLQVNVTWRRFNLEARNGVAAEGRAGVIILFFL